MKEKILHIEAEHVLRFDTAILTLILLFTLLSVPQISSKLRKK